MTVDQFYHIILFFCNFGFIAPLLILGIHFVNKKVFINAALIAFFSAFINAYLKNIWKVPLHPSLGSDGWAFPSGHTQLNVTLWLALTYYLRPKPWVVMLICLMLVTDFFGMIHFNYHNWDDVFAGIGFGIATFLILMIWQKLLPNKQLEFAVFTATCSLILYLTLPYQTFDYHWLFTYFGLFIGFIMHLSIERIWRIDSTITHSKPWAMLKGVLLLGMMFLISKIDFSAYFNISSNLNAFIKGFSIAILTLIIPLLCRRNTPQIRA